MKVFIFFLGFSFGIRLKKIEKIDREFNDLPTINHNTHFWSEAAINQLLELDLFQGDIMMAEDQPSSEFSGQARGTRASSLPLVCP